MIGGSTAAGRPVGAGAVAGVGAMASVDAVLALQGDGGGGRPGPEQRERALRKGRRLLDALDRLHVALLGTGPTRGHLDQLRAALETERPVSGDRELDEALGWAEVRAAVEAAKLEAASA
jgi:hypothetical protein